MAAAASDDDDDDDDDDDNEDGGDNDGSSPAGAGGGGGEGGVNLRPLSPAGFSTPDRFMRPHASATGGGLDFGLQFDFDFERAVSRSGEELIHSAPLDESGDDDDDGGWPTFFPSFSAGGGENAFNREDSGYAGSGPANRTGS